MITRLTSGNEAYPQLIMRHGTSAELLPGFGRTNFVIATFDRT